MIVGYWLRYRRLISVVVENSKRSLKRKENLEYYEIIKTLEYKVF